MLDIIKPNWPVPPHIIAYSTTRLGGYSQAPYDSLNLALHVGDNEEDVQTNRDILSEVLNFPSEPLWLNQIHGHRIICADTPANNLDADGSFAKLADKVCVIMTADCLPILISNEEGSIVMALHAGWRGLASGILEKGVALAQRIDSPIYAWIGPAIGQNYYEVGEEVRESFVNIDRTAADAFLPSPNNKWLADLTLLARQRLHLAGVEQIFGGGYDTYADSKRFYSYRRDGTTGRMASFIWIRET